MQHGVLKINGKVAELEEGRRAVATNGWSSQPFQYEVIMDLVILPVDLANSFTALHAEYLALACYHKTHFGCYVAFLLSSVMFG